MYAIRLAHQNDWNRLQAFLKMAKVSYHQVHSNTHFLLIEEVDRKKIVGTVGLEVYQSAGLLRAFVIDPSSKNAYLSLMLIDLILVYAKELSLKKVYLIAEKGCLFFERCGFQKTSFDGLPSEAIKLEHMKRSKGQGTPMVYEM